LPDQTAPLIVGWNGSRWSREPAPAAPVLATKYGYWDNLDPALFGISCPRAGQWCTAVGAQASGGAYGTTE
jgi:hypothetical protein